MNGCLMLLPNSKKQKKDLLKFSNEIDTIWGKPLDLLEILISVSLEMGLDFNDYYWSQQ